MKKKILSIITALALCLSQLPTAAFAEDHTCADEDGDHYCDTCWEYLSQLCIDGEVSDHVCGVCGQYLSELCKDENGNHVCDNEACGTVIGPCEDQDPSDHLCDNASCGTQISYCEDCDEDDDNICDLCGENIHPGAGELNIDAVAGDGTITVTWDALEDAGTDKVASYIVSCCLEETFEPLQQAVYEPGSDAYSHTFSGLDNHTVYDVSVEAVYTHIKDGYAEPFSATAIDTVTALPGAPTILSVTCGSGSVTVEWEAPENKGFPEIHSYLITAEQNGIGFGMEVEAANDPMSCTLDGLLNGNTYQIYVSALNDIGQGAVATTTVEIPLIPYELEIGGVVVTEENMDDVLGDGTVSYNPESNTLTLDGANIHVTNGNYGIRNAGTLNISLLGENKIICDGVYGLYSTDDVTVVGSGSLDVTANDVGIYIAGGGEVGGLYLRENVTLTVTSGNVTSGNSYAVRVDDVLEVQDNAVLTATAGTAPERSCGIYAYDEVNIYGNAVVTATGADQSVDLNTDCDGIRTTHLTIDGGTVTATGGTAATTNGIFTQTFDMYGGSLTAVSGSTAGGACFGPSVGLQANRSFLLSGGTVTATGGNAGDDQSCGLLVGNGTLEISGGSLLAKSGEATFSRGVNATSMTVSGGELTAQGGKGTWCSNGISAENGLDISGGTITATANDAETYSYGIQVSSNASITGGTITATAGSAANSYGFWAFGDVAVDDAELTAVGGSANATDSNADSFGIYTWGSLSICGCTVEATGGSAIVVGEGKACSGGVYTRGHVVIDFGGDLKAIGSTASGKDAYSSGLESYGSKDIGINVSVYDGYLEATGGTASGIRIAGSTGIYTEYGGLYVYDSGAHVTAASGRATVTSTDAEDNPYAYSNGIYVCRGDIGIDAGTVTVFSGSWDGLDGDGIGMYAQAYAEKDESGEVIAWYGGSVDIDCDEVTVSPHSPILIGTGVTITAADGSPAILAEMYLDIGETLTISAPEGAKVMGQGEMDPTWYTWDFYIIVDQDENVANSVVIEPLGYTVTFSGLSYVQAALVPAGQSLNEVYCERMGINDFSKALNTTKEGYTFGGWYTDEACTTGNAYADFDTPVTADITLYAKWVPVSYGGSTSSNTSTETTKNEDGSTTTTTTNKTTGTVTETTKTADGVTGTVVTNKDGEVTSISAAVPSAAAQNGEPVTLPIEVEAADNTDEAQEIKLDVPAGGATVEIPVEDVTPGAVAVIVNADGTEKIIMTTAVSESGVVITLDKDATIKIIDNSKKFSDVHGTDHWASDAIDFVTARGIFGGTSATTFTPNGSMTRQAMWMVLARMSGAAPADMAEAKAWAVENGVSDGSNPTNTITRQQFVTMLWRYANYKGYDTTQGGMAYREFADYESISEYAHAAMQWAVNEGIINGKGNGILDPKGTATRAQVAQMLMNFLNQ